jgi:hypothetical protein
LKTRFEEVPLWQLFLGVQAVDILFFLLAPLGIERLVLRPEETGLLKLGLEYLPFSHSLAAALGWGLLAVGVGRLVGHPRVGLALGLAVASHWFVDLPVHTEDLPIAAGEGLRVGLGMWTSQFGSMAFEIGFLVGGFTILARDLGGSARRRAFRVVAAMVVVQVLTVYVLPLPPSVLLLAVTSQIGFFAFAGAAWWIECRAPVGG